MTWTCICGEELDDDVEFHTHSEELKLDLTFMCCFCGEDIVFDDGYQLALINKDDTAQSWWCHFPCFKDAIHESAREFRVRSV